MSSPHSPVDFKMVAEELNQPFLLHRPDVGNEVPLAEGVRSMERATSYYEDVTVALIYGAVNYIVCVPTLVSYCKIVFKEPEFSEYFPLIVKLYYLSSALHQLAFCLRSSLEFAVGQVQDVGLIFLSVMVRNIVVWGKEEDVGNDSIVATSLWLCSIATLITGVCVILEGKFKLSEYVQMIPLPVVGGYLGYIGYFCLAAGFQIASGLELNTPADWLQFGDASKLIANDWRLARQLALLICFTGCLTFTHFKVQHFLAMPCVLLVLPLLFFGALQVLGVSVDECRDKGWLQPGVEQELGYRVYGFFDTSKVQWSWIPKQFTSVIGLVIVVSFGSSLDVAAVQEARPSEKLDYNNEMITVGFGNLISGLTGGATGSYIFSQTVFSAKRHVRSRANGWFVCIGELLLFVIPLDLVSYLPNAYIGACICLFGIDICADWLFFSRSLMERIEYVMVWLTFAIVMWMSALSNFGVIQGMCVSTLVAAFAFSVRYAGAHRQWEVIRSQSSVVRPWRERKALAKVQDSILSVGLSGYAFFFSSLGITRAIEEEARKRRPRIVCLDFGRLQGLDSTASAQLKYLVNGLEREQVQVLLSNVGHSSWLRRLLEVQGLVPESPADDLSNKRPVFETLDMALQYCEKNFLSELGVQPLSAFPNKESRLDEILLEYVEGFSCSGGGGGVTENDRAAAQAITKYFKRIELRNGDCIFKAEDLADAIYVITAGSITVSLGHLRTSIAPYENGFQKIVSPNGIQACGAPLRNPPESVSKGAIIGDTAYYVRRSFGCDAVANCDTCVVYEITRRTVDELESSQPKLVAFLQKVLLRDLTQYQVQFLEPTLLANGVV